MRNYHSLEEKAEINRLLDDVKKEYEKGIQSVLSYTNPKMFGNCHKIHKLKKIQINRGLGLTAQNTNSLKKSLEDLGKITGQKPIITRSKKAIAGFKVREDMEVGLTVTLRGEKMYTFLTKLIFFTFAQIRDFRGLSVRSFDKAGNYTFGLKEQLIFPEIEYEDVNKVEGFTITFVMSSYSKKTIFNNIFNGMVLLKFLRFPLNDSGYYEKYESLQDISQTWDRKKHLRRKRWSQE